jgi:hypothetical protein
MNTQKGNSELLFLGRKLIGFVPQYYRFEAQVTHYPASDSIILSLG